MTAVSSRGCDYCDRPAVCANGNGQTCLLHVPRPTFAGRYLALLAGDPTIAARQLVELRDESTDGEPGQAVV